MPTEQRYGCDFIGPLEERTTPEINGYEITEMAPYWHYEWEAFNHKTQHGSKFLSEKTAREWAAKQGKAQ